MDWDTLFPVIVGGLIATIPILISNLVQIYLKRFETKQKEKEANIQAKEKWIEHDILEIMESIDALISNMARGRNIVTRLELMITMKKAGMMPENEYSSEKNSFMKEFSSSSIELEQIIAKVYRLIGSFDEDLKSEYRIFNSKVQKFLGSMNEDFEVEKEQWFNLCESAGILQ